MNYRICTIVLFLFFIAGLTTANAKTMTYDFKDPKGVNAVSIVVDSMLEPNAGYADKISGFVTIDHANKKIVKGKLMIPTGSVTMSNPMMTKVLHSKDWLDMDKNPEITFVFKKVISISNMSDTEFKATVQGDMTIRGITQRISAPVSISFHPGKLGMRNKGAKGDIAILRSEFNISRSAFKIKPGMPVEIVGETIRLTVNIAGGASI